MRSSSHPLGCRHVDNDSKRTGTTAIVWSLALPLLALTIFLTYRAAQPAIQLGELAPISLSGHHKLLVLSPHCDDETLGAGGLIHAAQRAGLEVRVVIMTNGDGYPFATMQEFRRVYPHASDFIQMGNVRQQESLNALRRLGISEQNVTFLSYPDRGTPELWFDHWLSVDPYKSPFTESTRSPYPVTYDPGAVYAGEDLLADLLVVLTSYHPDLIVYPHPDDVHPDHWGLSAFARLAMVITMREDPEYQPTQLAYLVHRPDFPQPLGLHMNESLLPPKPLSKIYPNSVDHEITWRSPKTGVRASPAPLFSGNLLGICSPLVKY